MKLANFDKKFAGFFIFLSRYALFIGGAFADMFQLKRADGGENTELDGQKERLWRIVLLILLGMYILAFCIINFIGFGDFVSGDMYSDALFARYAWEQKSLFPENWVFGNQYYIIATPAIAAPFYGLTGSMSLSMALATSVETIALLAAIYWLFHSFLGRTAALAGCAAMVSAMPAIGLDNCYEGQILFVLASYYSCYLLTAVVVWGDYLQGLFQCKKLLCVSFFLSLALSFATGMQSVRQTCVMVLPLLAFEGLRLLAALIRRQSINWRPTLRAVCSTAANLGGVLFIHLLHVPHISIYGSFSFVQPENLPARFRHLCTAAKWITWLIKIGKYGALKDNLFVLFFCIASITAVLLAFCAVIVRLWKGRAGALDALLGLCMISLLAVCASMLLLNMSIRSLYLFMWFFLICLSATALVCWTRGKLRHLALVLLCVFSLANLYTSHLPSVQSSLTPGVPDSRTGYAEVAGELVSQGYEVLYGEFTAAGCTCWYTDGQVIASPWHDGMFHSLGYIFPQDLISPEDNQRAAYLIFDSSLDEAKAYAAEQGAELTLIRRFEIFTDNFAGLYTSSKQLMRPWE